MLVTESRPRNLRWFHAGPMLFGDWGTSRLYVLGLAFYYTAHASVLYLAVMSALMAAVAWAYTVVCRCLPDGGGVYAAARPLSPTTAVVGATLLMGGYIITASLSAIEGMHYFGAPHGAAVVLSLAAIAGIGAINWFGARNAGRFALGVALVAIFASMCLALLCLPLLPKGLSTVTTHVDGMNSPFQRWESLVRIVLALSGVEAVANMTGLMKRPVARTAKRTIWPVLAEVIVLNMVFAIALNALPGIADVQTPDYVTHEIRAGIASDTVPTDVRLYRDTALKVLATHSGTQALGATAGHVIGIVTGVLFGLLLLSAVNTAIMAMVSVMYSMAQERELPRSLARLNYSGVPSIGLAAACLLPVIVLLVEADVKALGELYAIGVVGAIMINLLSCAANPKSEVGRWERIGLWTIGGLMTLIEATIVVAKPNATIFAGTLIAAVLCTRWGLSVMRGPRPEAAMAEPAAGWLAELRAAPVQLDPSKPRIMLAARGRSQAEYAVDLARRRKASLFAMYVRTLRLMDVQPGMVPRVEDDADAQHALGTAAVLARQAGVPFVPIYVTSTEIADEIVDYTVTFGCDTLIMGRTGRSILARALSGDVVARVSTLLPEGVTLIQRAGGAPVPAQPPGSAPNGDEPPPT